jgi:hypothetical protein
LILREFIDLYICIYLDNILIYTGSNKVDYFRKVKNILDRLEAVGLYCDIKKSEFNITSIKFLGLVITTKGLKIDTIKIETICNWPTPRNIYNILLFLRFCNFYRRFIKNFLSLAIPLSKITKSITK